MPITKPTKKAPAKKTAKKDTAAEEGMRLELESKVVSLRDELSTMRQWALSALGEAERRAAELQEQNAALCRQVEESRHAADDTARRVEAHEHSLQEEKKLKLIVYGQTIAKHKEMEEESHQLQDALSKIII